MGMHLLSWLTQTEKIRLRVQTNLKYAWHFPNIFLTSLRSLAALVCDQSSNVPDIGLMGLPAAPRAPLGPVRAHHDFPRRAPATARAREPPGARARAGLVQKKEATFQFCKVGEFLRQSGGSMRVLMDSVTKDTKTTI